ncbi:MAG: hypothetical protein BWX72_00225 [Firmicutes bacterium ADurb.Bin080]|jgi:hypothetical protein|nr:MAG: hypothetical protein BWX72_00225 [Firmicutes bacterium ADurb.Bin080]
MKKKAIILVGILIVSSIFMISAGANYNKTISQNQCPRVPSQNDADDTFFVFTDVPIRPIGDGTLTVKVKGDYCCYGGGGEGRVFSEAIGVVVEGTSIGAWLPGQDCPLDFLTHTFIVTQSQLREWARDGKIEVKLIQGAALYPEDEGIVYSEVNCFCDTNINIVTLEYSGTNNSLPMNWIMKKFGLGNKE